MDCEESGEEVEVEIHDEEGLLQLWWKAEETDEALVDAEGPSGQDG